ncbi:hypothetical protein [Natrarchaeobius chitinivorans]|uniref:Uncharacterized protein n=1 Tax=Natrarchaeobius chitinivorans TaxID=1679083 RepID=A0A3N6MV75_NATCH|nr:hypothetical protein [Natrarchaeobius chitinivorans]RQG89322.1 hypothetical protein EA473_22195 [Natrarchaeobius chitinivorans]
MSRTLGNLGGCIGSKRLVGSCASIGVRTDDVVRPWADSIVIDRWGTKESSKRTGTSIQRIVHLATVPSMLFDVIRLAAISSAGGRRWLVEPVTGANVRLEGVGFDLTPLRQLHLRQFVLNQIPGRSLQHFAVTPLEGIVLTVRPAFLPATITLPTESQVHLPAIVKSETRRCWRTWIDTCPRIWPFVGKVGPCRSRLLRSIWTRSLREGTASSACGGSNTSPEEKTTCSCRKSFDRPFSGRSSTLAREGSSMLTEDFTSADELSRATGGP